jgi:hypothetical protein
MKSITLVVATGVTLALAAGPAYGQTTWLAACKNQNGKNIRLVYNYNQCRAGEIQARFESTNGSIISTLTDTTFRAEQDDWTMGGVTCEAYDVNDGQELNAIRDPAYMRFGCPETYPITGIDADTTQVTVSCTDIGPTYNEIRCKINNQ